MYDPDSGEEPPEIPSFLFVEGVGLVPAATHRLGRALLVDDQRPDYRLYRSFNGSAAIVVFGDDLLVYFSWERLSELVACLGNHAGYSCFAELLRKNYPTLAR